MNARHTAGVRNHLEGSHAYAPESTVGDDRSLVAGAKSGRASAFEALYERHHTKTYRIVFRILRNQQDAEDAVQQSFHRAFANLVQFREV